MASEITTKDRILDAAERIVLRDGVFHLTIEAVAAEASLSKGGVLYNFPTKDDLIRGMLHRLMHQFESEIAKHCEQDPDPVGRQTRARIRAMFPEPTPQVQHCAQVGAAFLAAVATNPSLLEPMRDHFRNSEALVSDGLDPVTAAIASLAAEGLWLADLFGLSLPEDLRRQVIARLEEFTREEVRSERK